MKIEKMRCWLLKKIAGCDLIAQIENTSNTAIYCAKILEEHAFILTTIAEKLKENDENIQALQSGAERAAAVIRRKHLDNTADLGRRTIYQFVHSFKFSDAIGNYVSSIKKMLDQHQIINEIIYVEADEQLQRKGKFFSQWQDAQPHDIILFHMTSETKMADVLERCDCRVILIYHNITPSVFFEKGSFVQISVENALKQTKCLRWCVDDVLVPSDYNKCCLLELKYRTPITTIPLLLDFEKYKEQPDKDMLVQLSDGKVNFLFTGRLAPNKCQHDIISVFQWYQQHINPNVRLILAGKYDENDLYFQSCNAQAPENVLFTGMLTQEELNACYQRADIFLCMSEHEGVCIPLIEAMYFDVPVIAFNSSAVPETLGNGGIILDNKTPEVWGTAINSILTDDSKHAMLKNQGQKQLQRYLPHIVEAQMLDFLNK